ncbi:DUF885 domain-containing protein [Mediterraneibacter glycyrrhizinilyticus]|uniref:DUF885 domain-containing protein n=1 Tax=Mediterraneibacter glycyrrhizinilyticus TaxID=342942 RepID=UPI00195FA98C|nr:DUF885 domain-containing protein [Mediterraneibacter glycyrrhizinilyticus]MBM6803672.1 DUF885 domain-containing protein [Mediterraneibacter glycyrrhizinilyticus]MDM8126679.1 DUF885 domain-containing protein [Mediterraneibacter glycyrrhizinilyticus]
MMRFLFSYIKSVYRNPRKNINILVAAVVSGSLLLLSACGTEEPGDQNEKFEEYTQEVFCNEVSSNTINLHYTLKNPEDYGITDYEVSLGSFESDPDMIKVSAENMRQSLQEFSYEGLNLQNRITFDILEYQVKSAEKNADYVLYEEPLGLVSGVQTQFPVVMSEYRFYDRQDVETYLELLEMTGEYFDSLIKFEREKADAGLFMADYALDTVLEQCRAFLDMGDGNYLYSTFADRIGDVKKLTKEEKSNYIQDNALAVSDYVFPAYEKLISSLEELRGSGENEKGLVNLPDGADYYELVVRRSTGSDRSVEEMEDLTRRQITDDLEAMEQVLGITTEEAQEAATSMTQDSAGLTLSKLQDGIKEAFPEAPDTALEVKYVPEEMEEHLSPAFYMIPAIDNTGENVIYINRAHMNDDLTLFTTLAHEGYPGHLYQTIYYESTDPDPVRSVMDFGGYVEGWATYAEMGSYYLTPLSKEQAVLLQKNSSIILGLYALADMGIHYEGWSRMDTVAFFSNYGITDTETIERIYELIIGSPGNYLKYYIGYVEFLELKKDWAEEKDTEFSQKEFHEAVLKVGPAPFDIVEKYIWEMEE